MELSRLIGFDAQLLSESFWTAFNIFVLFFGLSYLLFNPVRNVLEKKKTEDSWRTGRCRSGQRGSGGHEGRV